MNIFLPPTTWWQLLRGAEGAACSGWWSPDGPFLCWPQTLLCLVSSRPTQDPWHEAQVRGWAGWGSGRSPRSVGRPGQGEGKRPVWSWRKNWREVKRNCQKGELLLWILSYWGMSRVPEPIFLPCPEMDDRHIKTSPSTDICWHIWRPWLITHWRRACSVHPMCETEDTLKKKKVLVGTNSWN